MGKNQTLTSISLITDKVNDNKLFKDSKITDAELDKLDFKSFDLGKGDFLFHQDDSANSIYLVIDGEINLIKKQGSDKTQTLFSENSFLGHEEYFLNTKRNSIAVAIKDSHIVELSKENIELLLSQKNSVLNNIKNSIHALDMVNTNKSETAIEELTDKPEKKNSILPMELKTNNDKKYSSTSKDKTDLPESRIPDYNKVTSKDAEYGISNIISKLNEDLILLEKERKKIQYTVSAYESHNKKLMVEIERLRKQESKYINLDKEKNEILGWQSYRIIELEKEAENSKKLELEHKEKIDFHLRQEAKDKVEIQKLKSELEKENKSISELENSLGENKKTIAGLEEAHVNLLKEKTEQNKVIETQGVNLKNSTEKIENLKSELSEKDISLKKLKEDIKNNEKTISEQNNSLNKFKSENEELRLLLNKNNEETGILSTKINVLQNQLDAQKEKEKQKDEFILNQSHKISENESALKGLEEEFSRKDEIINKFIEDMGEFASGIWHKQNEINRHEEIINKFIEDIGEFANGIWHKQNEINRHEKTINKFIEEIGEFTSGIWHKQNEINKQADTINKLNVEIEKLKKSSDELLNKETISKEKAKEIETKEKEIAELNDLLIRSQKELSDTKTTLQGKEDQVKSLLGEVDQLKNNLTDQSELQKLKDDLGSVSAQLSQKDKENSELNNGKNNLLEKINNLEQDKEKGITELNAQAARFQEELSEAKAILKSKDEHINNLKKSLEHDLNSVSVQLSQKEKENLELTKEKDALLEKINALEQVTKENENQDIDILQELKEELNNSRIEIEESKGELEEKEKIIDQLRNDLENLESTKSEVVKILTVAKKSYQDKIKVKDAQISDLTSELEQLKNLSDENKGDLKLENQIIEPDLATNELTTENDKTDSEKKDITTDNDEKELKSDTTIEDEKILSKSKLISSVSTDSLDDNSFECFNYNDINIVNINLSRAIMQDALPLSNFLADLINSHKNNFIINLTKCEYIDSSVLGALVNALKKATTNGVDLRIVWPGQGENSMLHLTRMDKIFKIFDSLKEAVESYQ